MIFLQSAIASILHLKRRCLRCKRELVVALARRHDPVPCPACGAEIPAPAAHASTARKR